MLGRCVQGSFRSGTCRREHWFDRQCSQTKQALYLRGRATSGPSILSPQRLLSLLFLFFLIPLEPCEGRAGILWCRPLQQIS